MTTIRFHIDSVLDPAGILAVLTDFGPSRPSVWPTIDADHFVVHERGDDWAEVTEGTGSAWERSRYEWNSETKRVVVTTHDSKVFGPGGGWVFAMTGDADGSRVDVELTREPKGLKGKVLAALLPLVAPASLKRSFSGPLAARTTTGAAAPPGTEGVMSSGSCAVDAFERLLEGSDGAGIELAHIEAFEQLTTVDLDELFIRHLARTDGHPREVDGGRPDGLLRRVWRAISAGAESWGSSVGPQAFMWWG